MFPALMGALSGMGGAATMAGLGALGSGIGLAGAGKVAGALRGANNLQSLAGMLPGRDITALPPDLVSAYESLTQDQGLLDRRTASLDNMKSVMDTKGMDPAFRLALDNNLNRTNRTISGNNKALASQFARKNMGNSGTAMSLMRGNQADAYDSAAGLASGIAGQQMNRYDNAIGQYGQMAQRALASDNRFNQEKASARDSIASFNQKNKMSGWGAQNEVNQGNDSNVRTAGATGFGNQGTINAYWQQANTNANQGYLQSIGQALPFMAG